MAAGGTGNLPVPPGHWPGGRLRLPLYTLIILVPQSVGLRSGRQVAGRHRQVACATQSGANAMKYPGYPPCSIFVSSFPALSGLRLLAGAGFQRLWTQNQLAGSWRTACSNARFTSRMIASAERAAPFS